MARGGAGKRFGQRQQTDRDAVPFSPPKQGGRWVAWQRRVDSRQDLGQSDVAVEALGCASRLNGRSLEFERAARDADLSQHLQLLPHPRAGCVASQHSRVTVE